MKIAIATTQALFLTGGAEYHAENLRNALIKAGHEADIVRIPFVDTPIELIEDHIVAARLMAINDSWGGKVDLCIGLKFPAYFLPHSNKVIWALHQHRAAYELFNTEFSNLRNDTHGNQIRAIVQNADNQYLKEAKRIYANSQNVANRMYQFNKIKATPLYHPCPNMDEFYLGEYDNYILMPSRLNITKRQELAIEAMQYSKSQIKLYLVGKSDSEYEKNRLLSLIKKYRLENRIKYLDYVTQKEKRKLYANARAVLFIPKDEDYGYITLEGMSASKAIITAKDSGGPLEFVEDGKEGRISDPEPKELAKIIDEFANSKTMAEECGKRAKNRLGNMEITWTNVVKELTR